MASTIPPLRNNDVKLLRGTVVANNDPLGIGRIKIRIVSVHGTHEGGGIANDSLPWAFPCFPFCII